MMYTVDREANWSTSTLRGWDVDMAPGLSPRTYICIALILPRESGARLGLENLGRRRHIPIERSALHQHYQALYQAA